MYDHRKWRYGSKTRKCGKENIGAVKISILFEITIKRWFNAISLNCQTDPPHLSTVQKYPPMDSVDTIVPQSF